MEDIQNVSELPQLSFEAIRVLGALIEKSKTTPDNYPLTLNSLLLACNQKSSREPVVSYDENTVQEAIEELKKLGLVQVIRGDGRTLKYRHSISATYSLDPKEQSILCLLFLRGPLTAGEIKSNAGRLYDFDSLSEVQEALQDLASVDQSFVKQLERQAGKKESRYCHMFGEIPELSSETIVQVNHSAGLKERVEELEQKVANLEEKLMELWTELKG